MSRGLAAWCILPDMSSSVRRLAALGIVVGSIGAVLILTRPGEAIGPGVGGYTGPRGPSVPSQSQNLGRTPTPSTLSRQRGKAATSGSSSHSRPTTFGYWDGSRFVRTPGPWNMPDNGFKTRDQIPDQRLR